MNDKIIIIIVIIISWFLIRVSVPEEGVIEELIYAYFSFWSLIAYTTVFTSSFLLSISYIWDVLLLLLKSNLYFRVESLSWLQPLP